MTAALEYKHVIIRTSNFELSLFELKSSIASIIS